MEKRVSVIMATYNTPKEYLCKAIDSILNQTYNNIEFIIVCDGSIKDYNVIKEYNDDRIKCIFHEENKGLPASLNEAIGFATGEYIIRMDSDDISLKNRISEQVKFLEKYDEIDVCGMYAKVFGKKDYIMTLFMNKPKYIGIQLLYRTCLVHPTVAFRASIFKDKNIRYNEEYICAQDFEMWSKIYNNNNIAIIPKVGIMYRMHDKQASIEKQKIQKEFYKKTIKRNVEKFEDFEKDILGKLFLILGEKEEINRNNYEEVSNYIDILIRNNKRFNERCLRKVIYNRYFQLLLKNNIFKSNLKNIILNRKIRNKILKIYNLENILHVCYYKLKGRRKNG